MLRISGNLNISDRHKCNNSNYTRSTCASTWKVADGRFHGKLHVYDTREYPGLTIRARRCDFDGRPSIDVPVETKKMDPTTLGQFATVLKYFEKLQPKFQFTLLYFREPSYIKHIMEEKVFKSVEHST